MNLDPIILAELQRGGPPLWISGRTYPKGTTVRSAVNLQPYVRKQAGAGATDPSADTENWELWSKSVDTTLATLGSSVTSVKAVVDALTATLANVKGTVEAFNSNPRSIKSVQRGISTPPAGYAEVNVAIAPVNMAKSYLNLLTTRSYGPDDVQSHIGLAFVNSSTIQVTGWLQRGGNVEQIPVSWEVVEGY